MTKNEIIKRIEELKDNIFYLNMKDRWTFEDNRKMSGYHRELTHLENQLKAI